MATLAPYISAEAYSEKQKKSVHRLLETFSRQEDRLGDHYSQIRTHQRKKCHNYLHIRIPQENGESFVFNVFMRDVSAGGTSFVYPGEIGPSSLIIGLPIPGRDPAWFQGEIVRCKAISDDGFYEYGVKFLERLM